VGKVNKELWLLLSMVLIAGVLNFMVASQRVVLSFFFLPTLYSAYHFGRRHATMTACFSVMLVMGLTYTNPTLFSHRVAAAGDSPYFDLTVWGGILVVTAYAMGTLYERNRENLTELRESYDGIMVILQHFLSNQKYSQDHSYRVSVCAMRMAECMGLNSQMVEDVHAAALLPNVNRLGVSNEVLYKAANISQDEVDAIRKGQAVNLKSHTTGGSLRRILMISLAQEALSARCLKATQVPVESQVLSLADTYETLTSGGAGHALSPAQAQQKIAANVGQPYEQRVVDAFVKAFGERASGASAGN
jgi:hypothetical protein